MYNRASCDPSGKPWDMSDDKFGGTRRNSGSATMCLTSKLDSKPSDHMGPFIMIPKASVVSLRHSRRLPTGHFRNTTNRLKVPSQILCIQQSNNPVAKKFTSDLDKLGTPDQGFNVVCTTYRLTEHYHYWTKNNPMNVQLVPEPFVEIPAQLADEMGITAVKA